MHYVVKYYTIHIWMLKGEQENKVFWVEKYELSILSLQPLNLVGLCIIPNLSK